MLRGKSALIPWTALILLQACDFVESRPSSTKKTAASLRALATQTPTRSVLTPTPTMTPIPTATPVMTPTPIPTATPTPTPTPIMTPVPSLAIGNAKQFLADDYVIDVASLNGLSSVMNTLTRHSGSPVLPITLAHEGNYILPSFSRVVRDSSGMYKMWYFGGGHVLLATSNDGIVWNKPALGLVSYNGSTANNILSVATATMTHSDGTVASLGGPESIMEDSHATDPSRKFMASSHHWKLGSGHYSNIDLRFSPDGLTWPGGASALNILTGNNAAQTTGEDTFLLGWDSSVSRYVGYFRPQFPEPDSRCIDTGVRRRIGRSTSIDGISWTTISNLSSLTPSAASDPAQDFYVMSVLKADGVYWGFLHVLQLDSRFCDVYQRGGMGRDNTVHIQLVFSRDGINWSRMGGKAPFLPISSDSLWDSRENWTGVPVKVGNEYWFYYSGSNVRHTQEEYAFLDSAVHPGHPLPRRAEIGLAKIREDRFVGKRAGLATGSFVTKAISFSGANLLVNALVQNGGSVRVEIQDGMGIPIPGFTLAESIPVMGDQNSKAVTWNSNLNLAPLMGRVIRVKFVITNADLYTFQFL